jgi:hypothetical protein
MKKKTHRKPNSQLPTKRLSITSPGVQLGCLADNDPERQQAFDLLGKQHHARLNSADKRTRGKEKTWIGIAAAVAE